MRHFLCLEELLPRQTFCDDVSALGRQLGVRVTGCCRGEIEPHMGAYAVLGDASPLFVHDPEVELCFGVALLSRHSIPLPRFAVVLGDALTFVIAGRAAPSADVELLRNGYVLDRAVADRSGQFVMLPPRLPSGDYELTLRSRQPDGKEATSKRGVLVTLQPKIAEAPMTLDKQEAGIAIQPKIVEAPIMLDQREAGIAGQPKVVEALVTPDQQEAGITAYQRGDFAAALQLFQPLAEHGDASAECNLGVMYEQGRGVAQNYREAMRWFRLAALQGDASAQSNIGVMYSA
jgi:hypothetical protein